MALVIVGKERLRVRVRYVIQMVPDCFGRLAIQAMFGQQIYPRPLIFRRIIIRLSGVRYCVSTMFQSPNVTAAAMRMGQDETGKPPFPS